MLRLFQELRCASAVRPVVFASSRSWTQKAVAGETTLASRRRDDGSTMPTLPDNLKFWRALRTRVAAVVRRRFAARLLLCTRKKKRLSKTSHRTLYGGLAFQRVAPNLVPQPAQRGNASRIATLSSLSSVGDSKNGQLFSKVRFPCGPFQNNSSAAKHVVADDT